MTCKFGGTSLADANCIKKVAEIIYSSHDRKYIVPSAPGKRTANDKKITDLLYLWYNIAREGLDPSEPEKIIRERFSTIVSELGLKLNINSEIDNIAKNADKYDTPDYMASRGEYLNGKIIAEYLNATFVDPASYIFFDETGSLDTKTYNILGERLQGSGLFVVPGFYGSMPDGTIKTFPRGGSDITGAIVARATKSILYENWTDVDGFCMADPRIVPNAKRIEEITYQELRELSYMGATVLHDESIYPVLEPGIPIHIKNTKNPDNPGTLIVRSRVPKGPVCGVAGLAGFSMINIEKTFMNKERGFGLKVLSVLDEYDIRWEHMPTGIDTMSIIIRNSELGNKGPLIVEAIKKRCETDDVTLTKGLAMIATVGMGMNHHIGVAARLCTALANAKVNIRVIDQGSSEMNILVGVNENDLNTAIEAIYKAFENWD
ncbi:MAG: aspartate kinase [Candidatus Hydrogenedens sp.]|nr:aspartate kinase [Candidatus Hydrogenedens sp.]